MAVIGEHDSSSTEELSLRAANDQSEKSLPRHIQCRVPEFFAHKNIFVTGGTGFLGTVLIEALLDTHPDIGTIYVLVRGKRKFDPNERISRLLQKPIFQKYNEKSLAKVVPVVGELSEVNFGLSDTILNELIDRVNVIYHSAATIKFSSPLRTAIKTNVTATMRTIELAKKLKNLSAYIYLSTAFCNSNYRGFIVEEVYKSKYDPYDMMRMAEDDAQWVDFTDENCKTYLNDHPNTYTFTKNLSENLLMAEMAGMPTAIVRPSIVYGTWEHPMRGWVGNANSGHLGYLAGFVKGIFRTMCGSATAIIDLIPCDFVINSALVMGWYVGTHKIDKPEVIHCTSGEVNPLTLGEFTTIMNESVKRHPPDNFVWKPATKLRNGWRYNIFFYLFQILPALAYAVPEKFCGIGHTYHSAYEFMQVFRKGTKHFNYFMHKDFRYSFKNASRIISLLHVDDRKRYNFDSSLCDWSEFIDRVLIGVRRFYFKEAEVTTEWHHMYWRIFDVIHHLGIVGLFCLIFGITALLFGLPIGLTLALAIWGFLLWL